MMFRLMPRYNADAYAAAELVSSNISRFMTDEFPGNDVGMCLTFINNANERSVKEMEQLFFENFEVTRIYATPFGTNFASQRVLEKAGFTLEAMFEKVYIKNGMKQDELVYAIRRKSEIITQEFKVVLN
jgi:hypothetical protein